MKEHTYYSLDKLVSAGRRLAADKTLVSFDLFDTLLVRRIHDPDLVKLPVARFIVTLAMQRGIRCFAEDVEELRDRFEAEMRAENGAKYPDHEACYPVYMTRVLEEIFGEAGPALLDEVTACELEMEKRMLVPRRQLAAWLRELSAAGKRVVVISDMYLPAVHLETLLEHAGLGDCVEAVVSSADTFCAKASGAGWKLCLERFQVPADRWLHVGDNPISDGLRAQEVGITPLLIDDPREDLRKSIIKRYWNYSDGKPFWRGRLVQQLMAPLEAENLPQKQLYIEGYTFIGPLIGFFLKRVHELCRREKLTKIFFLSREGWTFERYWQQALPLICPGEELPETEYLYVSRMALAGASCARRGLQRESSDIAFLPPGNRDFTDVCRIFGLDAERFTSIFARFGLEVTSCLSLIHEGYCQQNRRAYDRILDDEEFQNEVRAQTADANAALQKYLEDVGFFDHQRVAIVDIGWLGSIQRFLVDAISHRDDAPVCWGMLFGATRGVPYPTTAKNSIHGVIYDQKRFDFAASTLFYARDIFEEACRAPHPTLDGYRLSDSDKGYELIFRRTDDKLGQAEKQQDLYFQPLQQGIYDSAARFGAAMRLCGFDYDDCKPWLNWMLVSRLAFPKTTEVLSLRNRSHLDDFHGNKKPLARFLKASPHGLWEQSAARLRWIPLLRFRNFLNHLRIRLNS